MCDDNMTIANDICSVFSVWLWQQNTLSHFHFDDDWTVAKKSELRTIERTRQATTIITMKIAATVVAILRLVSMRNDFLMDTQTHIQVSKILVQYSWMTTVCVCVHLSLSHHISIWHSLAHPNAISLLFYITLSIRFVVVFFRFARVLQLCCKLCDSVAFVCKKNIN